MNFTILDNVISNEYASILENQFFRVPFYYLNNITYAEDTTLYRPGFFHSINIKENIQSELYSTMVHLLYTFAFAEKINILNIIRSRLFLLTPNSNEIDYQIHRDYDFDHKVLIYYVNDSTGPTMLYNDNNKLIEAVNPKKGRGLIFDGKILHRSTQPINNTRLILNINFI